MWGTTMDLHEATVRATLTRSPWCGDARIRAAAALCATVDAGRDKPVPYGCSLHPGTPTPGAHAIHTFLLVAAVLCTVGGHTDELSYTAVSINVVVEDWDGFEDNSRGARLDGSVEIGEVIYVWGSVSRTFLHLPVRGPIDEIETQVRSVGIGIHRGLADTLSVHGEVGAMRQRFEYWRLSWWGREDAARETDSVNGWVASAGLRATLTDRIELFGALTHREAENDGVSTLSAGVEVDIYRDFGLRASVFTREDASGFGIGVVWRH